MAIYFISYFCIIRIITFVGIVFLKYVAGVFVIFLDIVFITLVVNLQATWCTFQPQAQNTKKNYPGKLSYICQKNIFLIFGEGTNQLQA